MHRRARTLILVGMVALCCAAMLWIDGVLQPPYAVKSAAKVALFLICPLLYSRIDGKFRPGDLFAANRKGLLPSLGLGVGVFALKELTGRRFAYVFSALAFAVYHTAMMLGWWDWWLFALALLGLFVGGLLFDFLNERTGTVWPSWMVHMFANFAINTVGCILFGIL